MLSRLSLCSLLLLAVACGRDRAPADDRIPADSAAAAPAAAPAAPGAADTAGAAAISPAQAIMQADSLDRADAADFARRKATMVGFESCMRQVKDLPGPDRQRIEEICRRLPDAPH
jgi:hypothetical protein